LIFLFSAPMRKSTLLKYNLIQQRWVSLNISNCSNKVIRIRKEKKTLLFFLFFSLAPLFPSNKRANTWKQKKNSRDVYKKLYDVLFLTFSSSSLHYHFYALNKTVMSDEQNNNMGPVTVCIKTFKKYCDIFYALFSVGCYTWNSANQRTTWNQGCSNRCFT